MLNAKHQGVTPCPNPSGYSRCNTFITRADIPYTTYDQRKRAPVSHLPLRSGPRSRRRPKARCNMELLSGHGHAHLVGHPAGVGVAVPRLGPDASSCPTRAHRRSVPRRRLLGAQHPCSTAVRAWWETTNTITRSHTPGRVVLHEPATGDESTRTMNELLETPARSKVG